MLAFARILNESETVIVANTDPESGVEVSVLVDAILNPAGTTFTTLYSSVAMNGICTVEQIPNAAVIGNGTSYGTIHSVRVGLAAGEVRILARHER